MHVVHQHKAEHQLDRHEQRVEVPDDGGTASRPVKQGNMISGGDPSERSHAQTISVFRFFIQRIVVMVKEKTTGQREGPILELLYDPVVGLGILVLKLHLYSHRLILKGQSQSNHFLVCIDIPMGAEAVLHQFQFVKGIK